MNNIITIIFKIMFPDSACFLLQQDKFACGEHNFKTNDMVYFNCLLVWVYVINIVVFFLIAMFKNVYWDLNWLWVCKLLLLPQWQWHCKFCEILFLKIFLKEKKNIKKKKNVLCSFCRHFSSRCLNLDIFVT